MNITQEGEDMRKINKISAKKPTPAEVRAHQTMFGKTSGVEPEHATRYIRRKKIN